MTTLKPDDVEWVVNDMGELGVKIGNQFFFRYKEYSIEYEDGKHEDGTPILWREIGKVEFGETSWPMKWIKAGRREDRYTQELDYIPGISFGKPDDFQWKELPSTKSKESNEHQSSP